MKNEYDYKMLTLRAVCLNVLYGEQMSYESIKSYVGIFAELQTKFSDDDIHLALEQLVNDKLISRIDDEYRIEEKGKEIRAIIMRNYFECGKMILNSFGFKDRRNFF